MCDMCTCCECLGITKQLELDYGDARTNNNNNKIVRSFKLYILNYHFRSKTYESPFPRPNYPMSRFRTLLDVDHIFFCKINLFIKWGPFVCDLMLCSLRVCIKIAIVDSLNKLFGHFNNFLTTSYIENRKHKFKKIKTFDEIIRWCGY